MEHYRYLYEKKPREREEGPPSGEKNGAHTPSSARGDMRPRRVANKPIANKPFANQPFASAAAIIKNFLGGKPASSGSSQVKSIHKQQTTIRKPIECAPEASRGGREWAEMTEGDPSRDDLT